MKIPKSWTRVTLLSKLLAIILFVSLPFVGFVLGKKYQKSVTVTPICQRDNSDVVKVDNCLFQDKTAKIRGKYVDKNNNFELDIPKNWVGKIEGDEGIVIQSPDLLIINEGYGEPVVGAEIRILRNLNSVLDLDEYKKNELDIGIKEGRVLNLRSVKIDGARALQYDWAWEGYGITTDLVKNGKFYKITMYYNYDQKSNIKYLDTYDEILSSFKVVEN